MNRTIKTLALTASLVTLAACAGEMAPEESAPKGNGPPAPVTNSSDGATGLTAMQRLEKLGLTDIRGIAYHPGPVALADGKYGFVEGGDVLTDEGLKDRKWTIYNDSDFANADFEHLWGKAGGKGRDDLGRFKSELNVNLVTLYDWNAGSKVRPETRNHKPFFAYADSLGIKVTAAVTDWIRVHKLCAHDEGTTEEGLADIAREMGEIYPDGKPIGGLGMIKVFNEPDNQSVCPQWASITADSIATIVAAEDALKVADADRVPIFVPVTFGIKDGIAGGATGAIHDAIVAHPKLGETFWKERMLVAVNPFNEGFFMKQWLEKDFPEYEQRRGIPTDTPIVFTEYGQSSGEFPNAADPLQKQAEYVAEQLATLKVHPTKEYVGSVAFMSQVRPWRTKKEPGFGLLEFGGDGGNWALPATEGLVAVKYFNPNEKNPWQWEGKYPVQRQTPRPAYYEVAKAYKR